MVKSSYSQITSSPIARATIQIWWMVAMVLIGSAGIVAALTAYGFLAAMVSGEWAKAAGLLLASGGLIFATVMLCRYRGDLVGD